MNRPLTGRSILVTRPAHQASALVAPLEELGAQALVLSAVGIESSEDPGFEGAMRQLDAYDWVVLTSVNGVAAVDEKIHALGNSWPARARLAVIGPATRRMAESRLGPVELMPAEFISEALGPAVLAAENGDLRGKKILLARADRASRDLAVFLTGQGAEVDEVIAYRIVESSPETVDLPDREPDAIALTSAAGARGTLANLSRCGKEAWMGESALVCIGPVTAAAVTEMGFRSAATAATYTIPGLVDTLVGLLGREEALR